MRVGSLSDGTEHSWLVVEYAGVSTWSGNAVNSFQVWITLGPSAEGIWFTYGADAVGDAAADVATGAENRDGTSGVRARRAAGRGGRGRGDDRAADGRRHRVVRLHAQGPGQGHWSTFATLRSDALRTIPAEQTKITVK